jgi:hypothetical protein
MAGQSSHVLIIVSIAATIVAICSAQSNAPENKQNVAQTRFLGQDMVVTNKKLRLPKKVPTILAIAQTFLTARNILGSQLSVIR